MKNIRCNICNYENELNTHYCKKCGKNISNIIEKTDVLFFFSGFMKFIGIFLLVFDVMFSLFVNTICSFSNDVCSFKLEIFIFIISLILIIIGIVGKGYTLKLCKQNISRDVN